jgi:hypothetical protein
VSSRFFPALDSEAGRDQLSTRSGTVQRGLVCERPPVRGWGPFWSRSAGVTGLRFSGASACGGSARDARDARGRGARGGRACACPSRGAYAGRPVASSGFPFIGCSAPRVGRVSGVGNYLRKLGLTDRCVRVDVAQPFAVAGSSQNRRLIEPLTPVAKISQPAVIIGSDPPGGQERRGGCTHAALISCRILPN